MQYFHYTSYLLLTTMLFLVDSATTQAVETSQDDLYDPLALYLTWQQDPSTTMTIDWHTVDEQRSTVIQYRVPGEINWQNRSGSEHEFPYSKRTIHRVELNGLKADTEYEFRFGEDSKIYRFRTMPEKLTRPLRIALGGDTMHHQDFFEETNRQVLKYDPDFVVIGGDIAYADGLPPEKQGLRADPETRQRTDSPRPGLEDGDNLWYHWFNAYKNTLITDENRVIPMLVTLGNHETSGGEAPYFFALFAMPGLPGYNVLDFGDYMSFILLDSGHVNSPGGEQRQWLENVLAERRNVPHVFPIYHVPIYPSVRELDDRRVVPVRENWKSLFEEYGIRVAFENHDHAYKRTYPIRNDEIASNGVVYIGDGSWGTVPREIRRNDDGSFEEWYMSEGAEVMHFILLTIDGTHQHMLMIDSEGNIIDEYPQTPERR